MDDIEGEDPYAGNEHVVVTIAHIGAIASTQLCPVPGVEFGTYSGMSGFFIRGKAAGRGHVNVYR